MLNISFDPEPPRRLVFFRRPPKKKQLSMIRLTNFKKLFTIKIPKIVHSEYQVFTFIIKYGIINLS